MPSLSANTTCELQASLQDVLLFPEHPEYKVTRGVWNAAIDANPTGIVRCRSAADVVQAVRLARKHDLTVAVRSGGHSPSGYGTCQGGIVLDLGGMKGIEIDAANLTARIEPGLTWGEVAGALHEHGLALTSGDTASVGVGGLTTGGGIGWMVGKYGLAIDRLRAVEMVTADGQMRRATSEVNADLFWAVRGGGGNFGVITSFEFDVHPGGLIYGGAVFYDGSDAAGIVQAYADIARNVPDELTTQCIVIQAPPAPFIPPQFVGKPVVAVMLCYCGDLENGVAAVAPFQNLGPVIANLTGPMPYPALLSMAEAGEMRGLHHNFRSSFLSEVDPTLTEALMSEVIAAMSPGTFFQLRTIHGEAHRIPTEATAFSHRDKPYMLLIDNAYANPTDEAVVGEVMDRIERIIAPYSSGNHANFLGLHQSDRLERTYADVTHERLREIKQAHDPQNVFCHNWNILPEV